MPEFGRTWEYADRWARAKPDAEAQRFEGEAMTWQAFMDQVDAIAKALMELGVEKGDRVAMISMARNEFPTTLLAAQKIGAMWLGLSPKYAAPEVRYMLDDAKPKVLVALREYQGVDLFAETLAGIGDCEYLEQVLVMGEAPAGTENFHECIGRGRSGLDAPLAERAAQVYPDDDALLLYTSGSTGRPKGVVHTHGSMIENIAVETQYFPFDEKGVSLVNFPINHVAAVTEIGFAAIVSGGRMVHMDQFDPVGSLEAIEREGVTVVGGVPVMYLMQMQTPKFAEMDWSKVQAFVWAGAAAPRRMLDVLADIARKTGAKLITGYGATEMAGFVTYTAPDDDLDTLARTVGRIAPPFELKIVDEERAELPQGEVGEVAVKGPFLLDRYLNKPEATAEVLRDGWYYSGDLGAKDARGYVTLSGRKTEMFKTGGENVFPREVEEVLEQHPAVLFSAVIGVQDDFFGEAGRAFVMLKPGQETTAAELKDHCKHRLANFKVPKHFDIRPELPLLPNGKVNKPVLKKELAGAGTARQP